MIEMLLSTGIVLSTLTLAEGITLAQQELPGAAPVEPLDASESAVPDLMETDTIDPAESSLEVTEPALDAAEPTSEGTDGTLDANGPDATDAVVVSEADLEKVAATLAKLQDIESGTKIQITEAIEGQGLSEERFNEIATAKQVSPEAEVEADISPVESEQYEQAISEIETIDSAAIEQQEDIIEGDGFEVDEFNQMLTEIQSDPELFEKVQDMSES